MHRTLSSTGVLAVSAMIDLAVQSRSAPVALTAIGQRQNISKAYLDQLFAKLRRHGLVRSTRGPGDGYSLGRDAARRCRHKQVPRMHWTLFEALLKNEWVTGHEG